MLPHQTWVRWDWLGHQYVTTPNVGAMRLIMSSICYHTKRGCDEAIYRLQAVVKESVAFIAGEGFIKPCEEGIAWCVTCSWTLFWLADSEVVRTQHHWPSGFNESRFYILTVSMHLNSSPWRGFQYFQNSSRTQLRTLSIDLDEELKVFDFL